MSRCCRWAARPCWLASRGWCGAWRAAPPSSGRRNATPPWAIPSSPIHSPAAGPSPGFIPLSLTAADWNLIVACDMPDLTPDLLEELFCAAARSGADAAVPSSAAGLDPLCAVYHRRLAARAACAISRKIFKMHDFLSTLTLELVPVADAAPLKNINTPEEWTAR